MGNEEDAWKPAELLEESPEEPDGQDGHIGQTFVVNPSESDIRVRIDNDFTTCKNRPNVQIRSNPNVRFSQRCGSSGG